MKKIIKLLLIGISVPAFSSSIFAVEAQPKKYNVACDLEIKLSGYAHFQSGFRDQSNLTSDEKNVSANRRDFAFFNETAFSAEAAHQINDINYGARIVLVPTAKRKGSGFNGSHIFMENNFGRLEGGSPMSASDTMMFDGSVPASATGGNWDRYINFAPSSLTYNGSAPSFATFAEFFLDSKLVTSTDKRSYSSEPGRRINYYTPKFEITPLTKVQLGISYTPDSSNTGADSPDVQSSGTSKINVSTNLKSDGKTSKDRFEIDSTVKDGIGAGVTLEQNITDGVDVKLAFTGEYGKAAGKAKEFQNDIKVADHNLKNLRTYNIGGVVNFGNFSCGGSYGSLSKSLTTPAFHKTGAETKYYTGVVAYKQGPFSTSILYFRSDQYKNIVDAITLGTDYKMAPGIKPYFEVSGFSLKGKPEHFPEAPKKKTRGTVALIGAKFSL